jgi:hypothetical protein
MSAVQARVHNSMKEEFKLLKEIIRDNSPADYDYVPEGGKPSAKQSDYDIVEVIPVSDPNSATMAQRIMQYQAVIQLSAQAPQIYDLPQLHRQMIEVLGIKNAEKLVPIESDMTPRDPVSENMAFLTGKPTKAFVYQDHDAHIAVHMALTQDPLLMAQIGQNPQSAKMQAEIMAHVSEHLAFAYRKKIEEQLGVPLPAPNAEMPEEAEVMLAKMVAMASQQVLAQSKGQAAQQQSQQAAQDPLIQMQMQELKIKEQDSQIKAMKVRGDLQLKAEELGLKAREAAQKVGEDPEMAAYRMQMEISQLQEAHAMEMAAKQQQMQIQQQQAMQQAQQAQQPKLPGQ